MSEQASEEAASQQAVKEGEWLRLARAPGRNLRYVTPRSSPDVSGSSKWPYTICAPERPVSVPECNDLLQHAGAASADLLSQCERLVDALADDLHAGGAAVSAPRRASGSSTRTLSFSSITSYLMNASGSSRLMGTLLAKTACLTPHDGRPAPTA